MELNINIKYEIIIFYFLIYFLKYLIRFFWLLKPTWSAWVDLYIHYTIHLTIWIFTCLDLKQTDIVIENCIEYTLQSFCLLEQSQMWLLTDRHSRRTHGTYLVVGGISSLSYNTPAPYAYRVLRENNQFSNTAAVAQFSSSVSVSVSRGAAVFKIA